MKRNHPDELRHVLARNVRLLRAQRAFSQEALAFASGVNRTYISDLERGLRNVSMDNISRIALALDVPAWRLLHSEPSPLRADPDSEGS